MVLCQHQAATPFDGTYSQPVSNDENSCISELFMDDPTDLCISGRVNGSCCFIQDEDLVLLEKRASKGHQLFLARRQAELCQPYCQLAVMAGKPLTFHRQS